MNINRLNIIEVFAKTIKDDILQRIVLEFKVSVAIYFKCRILCTGSSLHYLLKLIILWRWSFNEFPPWVLAVATGTIIPFVKINSVGAKRFYFGLDIMLKTS